MPGNNKTPESIILSAALKKTMRDLAPGDRQIPQVFKRLEYFVLASAIWIGVSWFLCIALFAWILGFPFVGKWFAKFIFTMLLKIAAAAVGWKSHVIELARISGLFSIIPVLLGTLALILTESVSGQTFATQYSFTNRTEGADPLGGVIQSGNVLYGTTIFGGNGVGNIFKVNSDGTQFSNLYSFTPDSGSFPGPITNAEGTGPVSALLLSDDILFGTAADGGVFGAGTVFKIDSSGDGFSVLHSFGYGDGAQPRAGLVLSGNTLYGTTRNGGSSQWGTIFAVHTDGTGFTNLYNFTNGGDGGWPEAGLLLSGSVLYGTTSSDRGIGGGTVFKINTDGTGFTTLLGFGGGGGGKIPQCVLSLSGNVLYGTTTAGGKFGQGTVFGVSSDGSSYTNLYDFTGGTDGASPQAGVILWNNTLYGTANQGGAFSNGTVFAIGTDGYGFTNLYNFSSGTGSAPNVTNSDGALPSSRLFLSGNTLYGTTIAGGSAGLGTVFSVSLPISAPELSIGFFGANVTLTWPTNVAEFTLQSATNLAAPAIWNTVSTGSAIVNGQNSVTIIPNAAIHEFFRLSR